MRHPKKTCNTTLGFLAPSSVNVGRWVSGFLWGQIRGGRSRKKHSTLGRFVEGEGFSVFSRSQLGVVYVFFHWGVRKGAFWVLGFLGVGA